jgi:uncharacterized protein (DUF1778 family)
MPSYGIIDAMERELISIKVSHSLKRRLRGAAQRDKRNLSDFIRVQLERKLDEDDAAPAPQKKGGRK